MEQRASAVETVTGSIPSEEAVRATVRGIVCEVTELDSEDVPNDAHYVDDLDLDSLTILEIAVEVEAAFKLGKREDELPVIHTIGETVQLVRTELAAKAQT